jgi:hypothetical protein
MHSTPPLSRQAARKNGAPGLRRPNDYTAFVLDPDGNSIEAVFRGALADEVIK